MSPYLVGNDLAPKLLEGYVSPHLPVDADASSQVPLAFLVLLVLSPVHTLPSSSLHHVVVASLLSLSLSEAA